MKKHLGLLAATAMLMGDLGTAPLANQRGELTDFPFTAKNIGGACWARRRPSFVGNMGSQRKRRKAIRQNPSLIRKYK